MVNRWPIAVIILTLVVACGAPPAPDTVTIRRIGGTLSPLERTVSDPAIVMTLYDRLAKLPLASGGPRSCPLDLGVEDHLQFLADEETALAASARTGGCMNVTLTDGRVLSASGPEDAEFWSMTARAAGVTREELLRQEWPAP